MNSVSDTGSAGAITPPELGASDRDGVEELSPHATAKQAARLISSILTGKPCCFGGGCGEQVIKDFLGGAAPLNRTSAPTWPALAAALSGRRRYTRGRSEEVNNLRGTQARLNPHDFDGLLAARPGP